MMLSRTGCRTALWLVVITSVVASITALASPVAAAGHGSAVVPQRPRTDTPVVLDGKVLDIAQVGSRVVMVGTFTRIEQNGVVHRQSHIAAYFLSSGRLDVNFRPRVDQPVNVVRASQDQRAMFIGGRFDRVDGVKRHKLARLRNNGRLDNSFVANAAREVQSIEVGNGLVYVGGRFKKIRGVRRAHLAALDQRTGAIDRSFDVPLTKPVGRSKAMNVFDLELTPNGKKLMVVHTASRVGGALRVAAAFVKVAGRRAKVLPWRTRVYDDALPPERRTVQVTAGALAPDGSYLVLVSTGGDAPPVRDMANAFSTRRGKRQRPLWTSRHFDSVYAVDISRSAVYVGGHFRYQEAPGSPNPYPGEPGVNYGGVGAGAGVLGNAVLRREQVGALDPATGKSLDWNPGASGFRGVLALTVIPRGLLLGHDGSRVGGFTTGRSAFFDFQHDEFGSAVDTFITDPVSGRFYPAGAVVDFGGRAVAAGRVGQVRLEVQDLDTRLWLRRDGSMGSYQVVLTDVSRTGANTARWSHRARLGAGRYRVEAAAVGPGGARDPQKALVKFAVGDRRMLMVE